MSRKSEPAPLPDKFWFLTPTIRERRLQASLKPGGDTPGSWTWGPEPDRVCELCALKYDSKKAWRCPGCDAYYDLRYREQRGALYLEYQAETEGIH